MNSCGCRESGNQVIKSVQIYKASEDTSLTFQVWEMGTLNLAHVSSMCYYITQVIVLVSLKASLLKLLKCRIVYFCV